MKKAINVCLLLLLTLSFQKVVFAEEPSQGPAILGVQADGDNNQLIEEKQNQEEAKKAVEEKEKRIERLRSKIRAYQENSGKSITTTTTTRYRENPSYDDHFTQRVKTVTEEVRPAKVIPPTPVPTTRVIVEPQPTKVITVVHPEPRISTTIVTVKDDWRARKERELRILPDREWQSTVDRDQELRYLMWRERQYNDTWFDRGQICRYVTTYRKGIRVNKHVTICKWRNGVRICYHPTRYYIYPVTKIVCYYPRRASFTTIIHD